MWQQIFIRACREKIEPSRINQMLTSDQDISCGPDALISTMTLKQEGSDQVRKFDAVSVPSNGSLGSIKVSWAAPRKPNGLLLSYTIRWKNIDIDQITWQYACIPHKQYLTQSWYIITQLSNGNYTVQVVTTTMAGQAEFSEARSRSVQINIATNKMHALWKFIGKIFK